MIPFSSYGVTERGSASDDAGLHAERIRLSGFTVISAEYERDDLAYLAQRMDAGLQDQAARAGGIQRLAEIGESETLRCCMAHDEAYIGLATNAQVLEVCRRLLGDYFVLMQQNGIVNPPGRPHRQTAWHRDLPYQHFVSSRPLAISALFCVDDFTRENGGTVVLPGTHKVEQFAGETIAAEIERPIEAPAGSFLVFDSMLYHRAGDNGSDLPRRAVNHVYTLPFIAQQISIPDVLGGRYADNPQLARLLGYETRPAPSVEAWWAGRRARRGL